MPRKKSDGGPNEGFFTVFKPIYPYVKRYRWSYIAGLLFLVIADGGQIVIPRIMGKAVDLISLGSGNSGEIGRLMLSIAAIAAVIAAGRFGWRMFIIGSARKIEAGLRSDLYEKMLSLSGSFFQKYKVGDLMARVTNDLNSVRMAAGMALVAFIDGLFMALVILVLLFMRYGRIGVLIVLPLPLVTIMAVFLGRLIGPLFRRVQERFAGISDYVQETLSGIRVVKSYACEKKSLTNFTEINIHYGQANMALVRFWGLIFPAMTFLAGLGVLLLLSFGGIGVIDGRLSAGDFVAALAYLGMLQWPAMGAGWVVNMIQRGAASMRRINDVLDSVPDIIDLSEAEDRVPSGDLEFRSVHYAYKEGFPILNGVSFTAFKGGSLGILGPTGCGKTTLAKLIPRLLDPPEGSVFIGGKDIRLFTRSALRRALGMVPQDVFLFSETIKDNILFSNPSSSDEELDAAVEAAGLSSDLPFFPQGLDTVVGERGVTLSGGQKQRIAIARALLADPEILVLDDALSAVDADTEERILQNLFAVRKGKTTLMISHRISAMARCGRCIVLEDGHVSAEGTPDELMKKSPFYRRIADLQSLERIEEEPS